ncbi:polysaccharide biosynthesis tyrosine autokinase [Dyadobacter sp. CY345]|uniref:GumC family protein n=1 Tax=Dyadobacter sp. CY345 TaxID=2909335 RepID=UPI001F23716A|nr:tyrosine-protein kinase [Dyadobacter sp. CY345]MCF2446196.1 polysaccharide biosynthesis tyrosine autokinase [Dyadobacter sp. CY345]
MNKGNDSAFFEEFLNHSDSLDIQKVFKVILSRWYWVAGSLLFFGLLCFLYLKLVTPKYVANINLKYLNKQSELDEITGPEPTFLINSGSADYLTEKYNVKSQEVVETALNKLDNPFTFYRLKDFREIDIYPIRPFQLKVLFFDPSKFTNGIFLLDRESELSYEASYQKKIKAGTVYRVPGLTFLIEKVNPKHEYEVKFVFNNPSGLAKDFIKHIDLIEVEEEMPVLTLAFEHHNKPFAKDFLEKLLESYQEYDLRQKQRSSDLTLRFINDQVKVYASALKDAARALEIFKQKNEVLDISNSTSEIAVKTRNLDQRRNESEIQKAYISMLENNLGNTFEPVDYLSVGLDGTTDGVLIALLEQFNTLISKRKDLLIKYSAKAPAVRNLDEELGKFRIQILENIALQKQKNAGILKILDTNIISLKKRFNQIPALEKNFIYLQSSFEVNKNIYSLLLNKEIESSIVRAGMLPSFRVITLLEVAKVSPKPTQIITVSIFAGLLIGLSSIFFTRFFNRKFTRIDLILKSDSVNFLGLIHHFSSGQDKQQQHNLNTLISDRSVFSESVSALRTRISFLKINHELHPEAGKQILITSEKAGEGKTFISINLALSLTKIGKKVIIIGCDLRKSKLHQFFNDTNQDGLSLYLQKADSGKPIKTSVISNLDYIQAGPPPFNPAELLQGERFQELLSYCRIQYDYVILDTAPVGLVSDNIPFLAESHLVLFILRWLYSEQEAYKFPSQLAADYNAGNIQVLVNDFYPDELYSPITSSSTNYQGYSQYRYDYTYDNDPPNERKKGKLKRIKEILNVTR